MCILLVIKHIAHWFKKPTKIRSLYLEAFLNLLWCWILIRLVPYQLWKRDLGVEVGKDPSIADSENVCVTIQLVTQVFAGLRRVFGGHFTCLMLALSARKMLGRRGISAILVLAVRPKRESTFVNGMDAHAWVTVGATTVVGGEEMAGFIPVGYYQIIKGKSTNFKRAKS